MSGINELEPFDFDGNHVGSCSNCGRLTTGTGVIDSCGNCHKNHSCLFAVISWLGGAVAAALAVYRMTRGI